MMSCKNGYFWSSWGSYLIWVCSAIALSPLLHFQGESLLHYLILLPFLYLRLNLICHLIYGHVELEESLSASPVYNRIEEPSVSEFASFSWNILGLQKCVVGWIALILLVCTCMFIEDEINGIDDPVDGFGSAAFVKPSFLNLRCLNRSCLPSFFCI